jgi:hypothetical protein
MAMHQSLRSLVCAAAAAGLLVGTPAFASSFSDAVPSCGDDKHEKDTKKPKPDEDKRPTNPA